jgi:AcrR family transcriptional regulator
VIAGATRTRASTTEGCDEDRGRRYEIRAVAARLFRSRGYHQTTMQQIADEAGILKGSLYYHYRSKEEMLYDISREPLHRLVNDATTIAKSDATPSMKIAKMVRNHIEALARSYPELMVITAETGETLPVGMRAEIVSLRRTYQAEWQTVVEAGIRTGEIRPEFPPTILVNYVLGAINWMTRWYDPQGRSSPQDLAEHLTSLVLEGSGTSVPKRHARRPKSI